jgi:putative phosphoribosyl transferase
MRVEDSNVQQSCVTFSRSPFQLPAELTVPVGAVGLVLFAHGSGSSRHSMHNQAVARDLQQRGLATLLFDLLTEAEEQEDHYTGHLRFDIPLLAERLAAATVWVSQQEAARDLPLGYFGSSTGAAAAFMAAAKPGSQIKAVVSRGGRPDLAGESLTQVQAPTLLIAGENDPTVVALNEQAGKKLTCPCLLSVVPGASHLFEEPGALEEVAWLASEFFLKYLPARASQAPRQENPVARAARSRA